MNVTDQLQKIGILFADERFVPILEQMSRPFVTKVEVYRITGEKSAHEWRKTSVAGPEKEVKMVGHKRPGEAFCACPDKELRKALEESPSVSIIAEDVATVDTADDYMLQKVR